MDSGDNPVNPWLNEVNPQDWSGFVYMSDGIHDRSAQSGQPDRPLDNSEPPLSTKIFPLATMQVGDRVRIVSLNCGEANNRLMGMGLMPDVVLEIISSTATGSVIVALQSQRLGLGADMAQRIQVMDTRQQSGGVLNLSTTRMATMQTHSNPSTVKLRDAEVGTTLQVIGYEPTARDYKRKLLAMGLTPGTELQVTRHAPLGDPTEIRVRGFQLSLRKAEADALIVTPVTRS